MCGDRIVRKAGSMAAASLLTLALVALPAAPRLDDISFDGTAAYAKGGNGGGNGGGGLVCARRLLGMRDRIYAQFATHNAHTAAAILHMAPDAARYEFQRLHGMGDALHDLLRRVGDLDDDEVAALCRERVARLSEAERRRCQVRSLDRWARSLWAHGFRGPSLALFARCLQRTAAHPSAWAATAWSVGGFACLLAAFVCEGFLDVRPHLITLLFTGVLILTHRKRWAPWLWPRPSLLLTRTWIRWPGGSLRSAFSCASRTMRSIACQ